MPPPKRHPFHRQKTNVDAYTPPPVTKANQHHAKKKDPHTDHAEKAQGTVTPAANFDPDEDVKVIYEAIKGWGTDEQPLIDVIAHRSNQQRQVIRMKYKSTYKQDLLEALRSDLGGDLEELVDALMFTPVEYDSRVLAAAIEGPGTTEQALIGVMCTRSAKELRSIQSQYKADTGRTLSRDIAGDTSGSFGALLAELLKGERDPGGAIDAKRADEDAHKLSRGRNGAAVEDDVFLDVICRRNKAQIKLTFEKYYKLTGMPVKEGIKKAKTGDAELGYLALAQAVQDPIDFYAWRLHDAISGTGTNDALLIRICVSRSEIDLVQIKSKYRKLFGHTLESAIEKECSGHYKRMLLEVVK